MSEMLPGEASKPSLDLEAGAIGASGGTLLAALASNLGDDNAIKSWLIILAPGATILIRYLWTQLRFQVDEFFEQRMAKKRYEAARRVLLEVKKQRGLSPEYRLEIEDELRNLEREYIGHTTGRFRKRTKIA